MTINISKIKTIVLLIKDAFGNYKSIFLLNTILGSVSGILGGIGIGAIIPLFSFITRQQYGGLNFITKTVNNIFSFLHLTVKPSLLLLFIVALFIFKAIVMFWSNYFSEKVAARYEEDKRKEIFGQTLKSSWPYLLQQKSGYINRLIMDDINKGAQVITETSNLILTGTSLIMYTFAAYKISPNVTLLSLLPGLLLFLFFKSLFLKIRQISVRMSDVEKRVTHEVSEHMSGVKIIKAFSEEHHAIVRAYSYFADLTHSRLKLVFYNLSAGALFEPIGMMLIAGLFFFSYHSKSFDIAAFAATIYLIQKIFSYLQTFQIKLQNLNRLLPHLNIMIQYQKVLKENAEHDIGKEKFIFEDSIEFRNVSFSYGENKNNKTLKETSFTIKKGQIVGLIGPSGAGKTTVADLLLRLFKPTKGIITVDSKDIRDIDFSEWRRNIGYVSQDVFLMNDTIKNNIQFYDESIQNQDIEKSARLANIYDTIMNLPEKFNTIIGERGIKLSGGQRQRIALARVLARKPKIIILDEATSALDNESEALIHKTINDLRGESTILIIAHRLSTIVNSDKLLILNRGRITEEGTPQDLLKNKSSYFYKVSKFRDHK